MEADTFDDEENGVDSRPFSRPFAQHGGTPRFEYRCYSKNLWAAAALLLISQTSFVTATELVCHVTFVIR